MSNLLDSVSLVITYFIEWLSSLTTSLISNPVLQIVFSVSIIFTIIRFILCLLIDRSEKKSSKKINYETNDDRYFDPLFGVDNYELDMSEYDDRYNV